MIVLARYMENCSFQIFRPETESTVELNEYPRIRSIGLFALRIVVVEMWEFDME